MPNSIKEVRLDKNAFSAFSSFAEAEAVDRAFWHSRTPEERLEALELMRQSAYGYDDPSASRLQRVFEVAKREKG